MYQLTEFQVAFLTQPLKHGNIVISVFVDPAPGKEEIAAQEKKEIDGLLSIGLLEDRTADFKTVIDFHTQQSGKATVIYVISEIGIHMFKNHDTRVIN